MTRALLIGYGKMGKLIATLAKDFGIQITSIVDHNVQPYQRLVPEAIQGCDVAIDFAHADGILDRIKLLSEAGCPMCIGATGWEAVETEAKHIVERSHASVIASPNFSLGVSLFLQLAQNAASLFSHFPQYDVGMHEVHHKQKRDAPSGTAKLLAKKVAQHYSEPVVSASRIGFVPGTHELLFDSLEDSITLTHTARNREGFAKGALTAANWIIAKKGWHTLDDLITDILKRLK